VASSWMGSQTRKSAGSLSVSVKSMVITRSNATALGRGSGSGMTGLGYDGLRDFNIFVKYAGDHHVRAGIEHFLPEPRIVDRVSVIIKSLVLEYAVCKVCAILRAILRI
jgi:hypothetical protein